MVPSSVVPVPSELGDDDAMAFIIAEDGEMKDPRALIEEHCIPVLPRFAIPRYVEILSELPLTETGKVRKKELRDRGIGQLTWDAGQGKDTKGR